MFKTLIAQINPVVGSLKKNVELICEAYLDGFNKNVDLVILPECALTGYPIDDLVNRPAFMNEVTLATWDVVSYVKSIAKGNGPAIVFGAPMRVPGEEDIQPLNVLWFFDPAKNTCQWQPKVDLPNTGLFDDVRNFTPGTLDFVNVIEFKDERIAFLICEDVWHKRVAEHLGRQNPTIAISINASPYEAGKNIVRLDLIKERIEDLKCPMMYVNMVGGQDEVVFDGASFVMDTDDNVIQFPAFEEDHYEVDFPMHPMLCTKRDSIQPTSVEDDYKAVVIGTRDFLNKQGFKRVVLGMSGGVDSGLVAAIACDAFGAENVLLVGMPSAVSSEGSVTDSEVAAEMLGAKYIVRPIEQAVQAFLNIVDEDFADLPPDVSEENIQSRTRGVILMAIANKQNRLLLTTGNRSENSVGYFTLYGDSCGAYNPLKNVYKTEVWDMCRMRNTMDIPHWFKGYRGMAIPQAIIDKIPSAELRTGQKDTDSLPDYPILDGILKMLLDEEASVVETIAAGFDEAAVRKVYSLLIGAEHKRRQVAPGVKLGRHSFGRERRYPIVNRFRE